MRPAWWYVPNVPLQAPGKPTLGTTDYTAPNPPFGATFTYFLAETRETARDRRRQAEDELRERGADIPFPGYETLEAEALETSPALFWW